MVPQWIYWAIIATVAIVSIFGSIPILRKNPKRYSIVLGIQMVCAISLCVFFQSMDFYKFALPLPYVLILVVTGFGLYVLLLIYFRPREVIFPFFFTYLNIVFILEYFLEKYLRFITYTSGWDLWDTYTWYWIYTIVFSVIGDHLIPDKDKRPISQHSKWYWAAFLFVLVVSIVFTIYVFQAG